MKLIKDAIAMILGNGFKQVIDLVYLIILSRSLSTAQYGTYKQTSLILSTLTPILLLGIPISLSYFLPKCEDEKRTKTYVIQTFIIMNLLGLVGFLFCFLGTNFISKMYGNAELIKYLRIFSVYVFLEIGASFYPNFYLSIGKANKVATITSIYSVTRLLSLILSIVLFRSSLMVIFISLVFCSLIKYVIIAYDIKRYYRHIRIKLKIKLFKEQVLYSFPIWLSDMVNQLGYMFDNNIVSAMFTAEQFAIYSNGAFEIPFIGVITGSITSVLLPNFSKLYKEDGSNNKTIISTWKNSISVTSTILIPILFIFLVFSKGFILILFSEKYLKSIPIFIIYLFMLPLRTINFGSLLIASRNQRLILYNGIVFTIVNILMVLIFVHFFSYYGAAFSLVISVYLLAALQIAQIMKVYKVSIKEILPWNRLIKIYSISMICIIPFAILNKYIALNDTLKFITFGCIYMILCLLLFVKVGMLDKNYLLGILKRTNKKA